MGCCKQPHPDSNWVFMPRLDQVPIYADATHEVVVLDTLTAFQPSLLLLHLEPCRRAADPTSSFKASQVIFIRHPLFSSRVVGCPAMTLPSRDSGSSCKWK